MQALDSLVKAGKVLYLGISDTPGESLLAQSTGDLYSHVFRWAAWIVVKANEYARGHGMAQFVVCTYP